MNKNRYKLKNTNRNKKSKRPIIIGVILAFVFMFGVMMYCTYCYVCYLHDNGIAIIDATIADLMKSTEYFVKPHFSAPFDILMLLTLQLNIWWLYVVVISIVLLMCISSPYNDFKGVEAGSADWASKAEEKENSDNTGIPIGDGFYVTVKNPKHKYYEPHNLNEIVFGGPGSGKTFRKIKPDIMQMFGSYVVTDPKGELYRDTYKLLTENGYKVKAFNLIDIQRTNSYNPFVYITTEQDIVVLANTFINASAGDDDKEDFWSGSAKSLLTAIMVYLWKADGEIKSFGRVVRLLNSITYKDGKIDELCELARCMKKHTIEHPNDAATVNWLGVKGTPEETMGGIAKTLSTRLDLWAVEDINELTAEDEMDFDNLGVEKTAIFLIIPAADSTYKAILNMFYSQLFKRLMYVANFKHNGRLPLLVSCEMDEFANIGRVPNFDQVLAVVRSHNIRACIVLQNLAQLKALYKDTWESIIGNCSLFTYLGTPDMETRKYVVEKLDKTTVRIDTKGHSTNSQGGGGSSDNESFQGRDLLTPSELLRAFKATGKIKRKYGGYCIEFLDEYPPFWLYKFNTLEHPNINSVGSSFPSGLKNNTNIYDVYTDEMIADRKKVVQSKMQELMVKQAEEKKQAELEKEKEQQQEQAALAEAFMSAKMECSDENVSPLSEQLSDEDLSEIENEFEDVAIDFDEVASL